MSDEKKWKTETEAAMELGMRLQKAERIEDGPLFCRLPEGAQVADLEKYMPNPVRIRGRKGPFLSLMDFCAYVTRFKTVGTTLSMYRGGQRALAQVMAVLDYHEMPGAPRWCEHEAVWEAKPSEDWTLWSSRLGNWIGQMEFAEFLEDAAPTIRKPVAAAVVETARSFSAVRSVRFRSGVRTSNGDVELLYDTSTEANAGAKGKLEVPERMEVEVPLIWGGEAERMEVRLYWRISEEGKVTFRMRMPRVESIWDEVWRGVVGKIEMETGIKVWWMV